MASEERVLLANFLLSPAPFPNVLTQEEFVRIFPAAHRSSPAIAELYNELRHIRRRNIENVRQNIENEVRASKQLRREYRKNRQVEDHAFVAGLDPVALAMEVELSGHGPRGKPHTLQTVRSSMEDACVSIQAQIATIEADIEKTVEDLKTAIGDLSDLRYGQLAKSARSGEDITDELLATLKRLEAACGTPAG
ncbi:hypothetical protein CC78DRAFT_537627 [Lojkania enalia]|uniref:Cnl2/NKP2 family protein n=1 Tax=Lojkania enalia TaxID=147567 RepID=A0A9P4JY99_9PLEO|nr:hypothetical protein CC78DRAFT_537627 [Didymosphaeria enalia]